MTAAATLTAPIPVRSQPRPVLVPDAEDGVLPPGLRAIVTATLIAATFMEVVDTSIVNVALPNMQGALGVTLDDVSWVSTAYIISNVIFLPLTAWLSDFFGRRLYLAYSLILFTLASAGCGLSHNLATLVVFRFLQGAGGAAFLSTSQATLMEIYPKRLHGLANALFGMGVVMAPTVGPTIGGVLTDQYSWPWIFFVNLPLGVVALFSVLRFVTDAKSAGKRRTADWAGIAFLAVGLGCLQTVLERGERDDWFQAPYLVALSALATLGLALFVLWELRAENHAPAVDVRLIENRNLLVGSLYAAILGFLLYGSIFAIPQFLQGVQGHTAEQTGLLLLPGGLATLLGMAIVSQLITRVDIRILVGLGMAGYLASALLFADRLSLSTNDFSYFGPLILRGLGFGLAFVPLSSIALGTLSPGKVAQGAGLFNLFRQLGGSFGIALLTTLLDRREHLHYARLADHVTAVDAQVRDRLLILRQGAMLRGVSPTDSVNAALGILTRTVVKQAFLMAFIDVFLALAAMAMLGVLLVFLFRKPGRRVDTSAVH